MEAVLRRPTSPPVIDDLNAAYRVWRIKGYDVTISAMAPEISGESRRSC